MNIWILLFLEPIDSSSVLGKAGVPQEHPHLRSQQGGDHEKAASFILLPEEHQNYQTSCLSLALLSLESSSPDS